MSWYKVKTKVTLEATVMIDDDPNEISEGVFVFGLCEDLKDMGYDIDQDEVVVHSCEIKEAEDD